MECKQLKRKKSRTLINDIAKTPQGKHLEIRFFIMGSSSPTPIPFFFFFWSLFFLFYLFFFSLFPHLFFGNDYNKISNSKITIKKNKKKQQLSGNQSVF